MYLEDVIDPDILIEMIEGGFIKEQRHPAYSWLRILNYTEKAQFDKIWNQATLRSRGLIYNAYNRRVLARPFEKFFNYEEHWGSELIWGGEPVVVTDKMDGSLGIMYDAPDGKPAIATRGSFMSDQAVHATELLRSRYANFRPRYGMTYLFEIIYPENQIVVNYGGQDDLVLIGSVDIRSGMVFDPEMTPDWPGPKTEVFPYRTMDEALSAPPRPGKEGLVVRSLLDGTMFKLKQEDYIQLHRIVTNPNDRTIWERCMSADLTLTPEVERRDKVMEGIPDELYEDVWATASGLFRKFQDRLDFVQQRFRELSPFQHGDLGQRHVRALFASRLVGELPWLRSGLWLMYDGKYDKLHEYVWKSIKPRGDNE